MAASRHEWWVIGSAAVALHLGRPILVADVDVLASREDAAAALAAADVTVQSGEPDERFRSAVLGRVEGALCIEVMGGLKLRAGGGWRAVSPATRVWTDVGAVSLPVPDLAELRALLLAFGRSKDRERAALLG